MGRGLMFAAVHESEAGKAAVQTRLTIPENSAIKTKRKAVPVLFRRAGASQQRCSRPYERASASERTTGCVCACSSVFARLHMRACECARARSRACVRE
eukprot:974418-Pleurochrysis_carterae.AAC.3